MDTADAPAPPPRRKWFYRDPNSGEPAVTTVMSVQVGGEKRWVLAQMRVDEGDDFIVSDSAGRIPVFESREDADGYIARWFPLAGGDSSKDAVAKEYGRMLAVGSPLHVDLDAAARWASNPHAREVGPIQLLRVWRTLASADAVLPPMQFDPMGMAAVAGHMDRDGVPDGSRPAP